MTVWFTADHHFGHRNIIALCNRPFADVEEMDEALIDRWNAVVGAGDEVWHLGDFAYRCGPNRIAGIFERLRGSAIHLVRGSHDRTATLSLPWASVQHYAELVLAGRHLILFHYALCDWNRSRFGSLALHAHTYGRSHVTAGSCDVGVDGWDYKPVALDVILARIAGRSGG